MIEIDLLPAPTPTPTSPSAREDAANEFASAMQDANGRGRAPVDGPRPEQDDSGPNHTKPDHTKPDHTKPDHPRPDHPGAEHAADAGRPDHAALDTPAPEGVGPHKDLPPTAVGPNPAQVDAMPVDESTDISAPAVGSPNDTETDAALPGAGDEAEPELGPGKSTRPDTPFDLLAHLATTKQGVTPAGLTVAAAAVAGEHRSDDAINPDSGTVPGGPATETTDVVTLRGNAGPAHEMAQPRGIGVAANVATAPTGEVDLASMAAASAITPVEEAGQSVALLADTSLSADPPTIPALATSGGADTTPDPSLPSSVPVDSPEPARPEMTAQASASAVEPGTDAPAPSTATPSPAPATVSADAAVAAATELLTPAPTTPPAGATTVDPTAAAEAAAAAELDIPTPPQQIAEALRDVRRLADGSHRLSLQLYPEELGVVQLEVAVRDGQLHLRAATELESTRRLLTASLPELRGQLTEAGVTAGSLEVGAETAGGDRSARDGSPDATRRAAQGPSLASTSTSAAAAPTASTPTAPGRLDVRI